MACSCFCFFFFNDTATTEIYTLSLHDALPICLHEIEQCPAEEQRTMNVKDRRPMESTAGDAGPIGRREATECHQHEDAGHPQIEMALAGAQDRVAGDRRLQCATSFHGALPLSCLASPLLAREVRPFDVNISLGGPMRELLILRTPRGGRIEVPRAPFVGHVIQA